MKKLLPFIILFFIFISCNTKSETKIDLISNDTTWVGYKDFQFQKDLILCGVDSVAQIQLTKKLNENDRILDGLNKTDNRFVYSTVPNEVGYFEIEIEVKFKEENVNFSQFIVILPKQEPVGFNTKNASNLKVGVENEIEIVFGFPKKYGIMKTDNGKIFVRDGKTIIIPEREGDCEVKIDVKLPSNEKIEFNSVMFKVTK